MTGKAATPRGFEVWAYFAFGVIALTALVYIVLGLRTGGELGVALYLYAPVILGLASAALLTLGLGWSLWRRPALQRGRIWPLGGLAACLWLCSFPLAYPSSHEGKPSTGFFRLPFEGTWRVTWAGDRRMRNPLVLDPPSRFGLRFDPPTGSAPEDEGAAVLAPAAGEVLAVEEDTRRGPYGARVVLAVAPEEFLVLAGLRPESISVAAGGTVEAGAPVGRVGSQGLICSLRDRWPGLAEGIPLRFRQYEADGRSVAVGTPVHGEAIRPEPAPGPVDPGTR